MRISYAKEAQIEYVAFKEQLSFELEAKTGKSFTRAFRKVYRKYINLDLPKKSTYMDDVLATLHCKVLEKLNEELHQLLEQLGKRNGYRLTPRWRGMRAPSYIFVKEKR